MANSTACDDGNACTKSDSCQAGACVGKSPVACDPQDGCHLPGTCDPQTGKCSTPVQDDGTTCTPAVPSACFSKHACVAGACAGAKPVVCAAVDDCHEAGTCDAATGACSSPTQQDGTPCAKGACQSGVCMDPSVDAGTDAGPGTDAGADAGPDTDGGAGGDAGVTDAGGTTDAGSTGTGQTSGGGSAPTADAGDTTPALGGTGCNCVIATSTSSPTAPLGAIAALLLAVASRRRRR